MEVIGFAINQKCFFGKSTGGGILGLSPLKKRERDKWKKKSSPFLTPSMFLFLFLFLASHLKRGNIVIPFLV